MRKMADISKEIQNFRSARKGKDVRGSMISLAEKVNREAMDASQAAANSSASAGAAASNAQLAVTRANTAVQNANQAAQDIQDKADAGDFTGTIQIGTVTTGEPGSGASVSNSGTAKDAVLDITIPRGNQGVSFRMRKNWMPDTDYVNDTSYIDIVSYNGSTYGCLLSHQSSELVTPANTEYWQCLAQKGATGSIDNIDDVKIGFVEAEKRANISPEDTLAIILGKVEKIYADLKDVAFSGKYSDLSETLTKVSELENDAGYVTTDTWKANTAVSEGYVPATGGIANGIYGTDATGNPQWKEGFDIDIDVKPDFTGTLDELYAAMEDGSAPVDTIAFVENDTEFESDDFLLTEDRVLVTGSDGVYPSETTAQELEYLSGVTGNVQEQINSLISEYNSVDNTVKLKTINAASFRSVLENSNRNYPCFIAFYNPTDNPFSFNVGFCTAFTSGMLFNTKTWVLIGFRYNGGVIEAKQISWE